MTLAFPATPGNTVITGPAGGHQLEPDVNGNLVIGNANANGQALMVASSPVVIASDQTPVAVKDPVWTMIYSTTQTNVTTWAGSGDVAVSLYSQLIINWRVSAITSGSIQLFFTRKDSFGNYYGFGQSTARATTGLEAFSVGAGLPLNNMIGNTFAITTGISSLVGCTFTLDVWAR